MGRTRESANLVSDKNIFVDIANDLVGIGTTAPTATLEVSGTLNVSGVSTFQGNVTMSGDLTVNGTTTTLDTNLQEVDLINVQANASVPAIGVTQSGAGNVAKFYNGSGAVFTIANGGNVTVESGTLTLNNNLDMQDDDKILLGTGDDIQIWHSGTYSNIKNDTGQLRVRSDDLRLQNNAANENYITCTANGAVNVYYDNSKKLETTGAGVTVTGITTSTGFRALGGTFDASPLGGGSDSVTDAALVMDRGNTIYVQDGGYLRKVVESDGTEINIGQQGTTHITEINVRPGTIGGQVKLHAGGDTDTIKLQTTGGGVNVTGICTATSFSGDGANLTNVPTGFSPINFVLS